MELTPEIIAIGSELAIVAGRRSVETIFDKMKSIKKKGDKDEIINSLEEIINELIADKNDLIRISHAYEECLISQQITDKEINYIASSIIPILESFIPKDKSGNDTKTQEIVNSIKTLLSEETFNILQILGFNFKKAIGEPLTDLLSELIRAKTVGGINSDSSLQILEIQRELEYLKVCQDEESFSRFKLICNRTD